MVHSTLRGSMIIPVSGYPLSAVNKQRPCQLIVVNLLIFNAYIFVKRVGKEVAKTRGMKSEMGESNRENSTLVNFRTYRDRPFV